eukprot:1602554-Prymnesium_polylepis.1
MAVRMRVRRDQSSVHRLDLHGDHRSSAAAQHPDRVGKPVKGGAVVGARGYLEGRGGDNYSDAPFKNVIGARGDH